MKLNMFFVMFPRQTISRRWFGQQMYSDLLGDPNLQPKQDKQASPSTPVAPPTTPVLRQRPPQTKWLQALCTRLIQSLVDKNSIWSDPTRKKLFSSLTDSVGALIQWKHQSWFIVWGRMLHNFWPVMIQDLLLMFFIWTKAKLTRVFVLIDDL